MIFGEGTTSLLRRRSSPGRGEENGDVREWAWTRMKTEVMFREGESGGKGEGTHDGFLLRRRR